MTLKIRLQQNQEEQENKIANYLDNQRFIVRNEQKNNFTRTREPIGNLKHSKHLDNKRNLSKPLKKLIYGHNFSLPFPLQQNCKIPFTSSMRLLALHNNKQYLLNLDTAFIRQTTKNLIIYPKFETLPAIPGNSKELKAILRAKCQSIAKHLQEQYIGLKVIAPEEPSTQEYAIKDGFAAKIPFSFKNDIGVIDKSVRIEQDGHKVTGGEIEYFSPEHADLYLKMPIIFSEALAGYSEQIRLHLSVLQDMKQSLREMRPKRERMPSSLRNSATFRAVS